jgi:putative ABC transport system permease protein
MSVQLKKAFKDVTRRKLRTTLTVLGIAVGVLGLTAINVASSQLKASIAYTNDISAQPDISFVTSPSSPSLAQTLAAQPNVRAAQAETQAFGRWAIPSGHYSLAIIGVADPGAVQIGTFQVSEGQLPSAGEILLESGDRAVAPVKTGDTITVQVAGSTHQLRVSGLARTAGLPTAATTQTATGYMWQSDVEGLVNATGANVFAVQLRDYGQRQATAKQLAEVFNAAQVRVLSIAMGRASDSGVQTINGLFSVMQVLSIIALLLSIFLLLSTITTLIGEQLPIIGTMKAIGAGSGQILRSYLTSVLIYGVIGTAVGMALGVGLGYLLFGLFASLFTLDSGPLSVGPSLVVESLLVGIGIPLLAALLPIFLGTRITVQQALSGYGLESGSGRGRGWASAIGRIFAFVPQTVQLGMRSLFRRRTRALLTLLALTISAAAFLAVQTSAYAFGQTLTGVFDTYHADVFAAVSQPVSYNTVQQTLATVPGVSRTEPLAQAVVTTSFGSVLLTGTAPDAVLYQRHLLSGRWFSATDSNVALISQDAANKSGLKVGDSVAFHDAVHSANWTIIGIAQDYNGITMSGVLLAPVSEVNAFQHLPADYTSAVLIQSASRTTASVNALARQVDDTLGAAGYQDRVLTIGQIKAQNESVLTIIYGLLYAVAAIIALVGAIGLFNALAMSVLERRREIGILRSMGATSGKVAQVFWTEGLSLGALAWVVALVVGIPAAYGFVRLLGALVLPVPFAFSPVGLVAMLVFMLVVASVASLGPVVGASRVKIAQTLRYE